MNCCPKVSFKFDCLLFHPRLWHLKYLREFKLISKLQDLVFYYFFHLSFQLFQQQIDKFAFAFLFQRCEDTNYFLLVKRFCFKLQTLMKTYHET